MQNTEKKSKEKNEKLVAKHDEKILSSEYGKTSSVAMPSESNQLSKNLAVSLMGLIKEVNAAGVTPETVNASCNVAAQIYKILRLNYEMKKEGF